MNIIQIIPGSGGSFYCGNCLRDSKFYETLKKMDHNVTKIPMYLPLFSDEHDISNIPVFYGAVSIYLKQLFPVFRNAPAWFDKFLNSKSILKYAASMAGSTRATGLEEMTISMLMGEEGQQKVELEKMTDWIAKHCKPDVIHLSNALLLGLAKRLKEKLNVPIVCSLQDEDTWVDVMNKPHQDAVWKLMSKKTEHVDLFVSVSKYYANVSKKNMHIPDDKIQTIFLGIDPEDYTFINACDKPRNIGFISRMCHENGLDILVDAFIKLKEKTENKDVKLIITGGHTGDDKKYLKKIRGKIQKKDLNSDVEFHKEFEGEARQDFFKKVSVLSVPVRKGEAFGIYLTEAMASGIPIVQPALGAFPEIIKASAGGLVYNENTPELLAQSIDHLINDKKKLSALSIAARQSIMETFNIKALANQLIKAYQTLMTVKTPLG